MPLYDKIKTFEELCLYGAKYVNDEVCEFPGWLDTIAGQTDALYELNINDNAEYKLIKDVIYKCNLYGFFTYVSQPENTSDIKIYKSLWHRFMRDETSVLNDAEYTYKQRHSVSGFMKKDMALYVKEILSNNPYYSIYISCETNEVIENEPFISMTFRNNVSLYELNKEIYDKYSNTCFDGNNSELFKKINDIMFAGCCPGVRYEEPSSFKIQYEKYFISLDKKLFEDNIIVKFEIMDRRWNSNSCDMWIDLLKTIESYK